MTKKTMLIVSVSILLIVVIGLIAFHSSTNAPNSTSTPGSGILTDQALNVIDSMQAGNYQQATRDFDSRIAPTFSQQLTALWPTVTAKAGALKSRTVTRVDGNKVYITCIFEKGNLYGVVEFGSTNKIVNFSMYGQPV
ncbi:MAG: hypothetical protein NT018_10025 [Armatimonadetes bacterium]|nr:hypothetical protein [Armatimonadota bacterium]